MKRLVFLLCLFASPAFAGNATFSADGTWTPPSGVTVVTIHCRGAGGNGAGPQMSSGGGGGGGGAYARITMTVTSVQYSILAGPGKPSKFYFGMSDYCLAAKGADAVGVSGGLGGSVADSIGDVRHAGGNGANSPTSAGGGGGSSGGTDATGNAASGSTGGSAPSGGYAGGNGGFMGQAGQAGQGLGAGGGGAGPGGPAGSALGGAGEVMIMWDDAAPPPPEPETKVATPVFSPPGQEFAGSITVSLTTATAGAVIRYTVDGSTPTTTSPVWQGDQVFSRSTTVKARAFKSGMTASDIAQAEYVLNADPGAGDCVDPDANGSYLVWRCADGDGDGLPDALEGLHASDGSNNGLLDPAAAGDLRDTDGDGAPDFWEVLRWYKCWIPHITTCHCTTAEVYEYLSSFNGSGSVVPGVNLILANKSDGYAHYDANNDGVWDGCPSGSSGGSHTGHCCNCCCSACQASQSAGQQALWGQVTADPEDTDGDGCPDWKDPEPENSQVGCEGRPDDMKSWWQERLQFGTTGINSELTQTGHVLPLQFDIPGLGYTTFYLASMPDTSTAMGAAIDAFRVLCRSLALVGVVLHFSYQTYVVLRQY